MVETFKCAMCKQEFGKGWSDDQALEALAKTYGQEVPLAECTIFCDDCYKRLQAVRQPMGSARPS